MASTTIYEVKAALLTKLKAASDLSGIQITLVELQLRVALETDPGGDWSRGVAVLHPPVRDSPAAPPRRRSMARQGLPHRAPAASAACGGIVRPGRTVRE